MWRLSCPRIKDVRQIDFILRRQEVRRKGFFFMSKSQKQIPAGAYVSVDERNYRK